MRSKHFLGLCLAVGSFAAAGLVTGCGGDTTVGTTSSGSGGGDGGAGSTTAATTTSAATTSATTSTSTSTGAGGAGTGNHDFGTAVAIDINPMDVTAGTLVDADTTTDYYKFTGTKGQRITVVVTAQSLQMGSPQGDDNTITDTVVTIYDTAKKQIAQNDDAWPRSGRDSQAFTVLPADGEYYVAVNDCNAAFGAGCAPPDNISILDYELFIAEVDKLNVPDANEGAEPNDTIDKAAKVTYLVPKGDAPGQYGTTIIEGSFQSATDIDVYALTFPADTVIGKDQRAHAEFWVQPITAQNGTGATTNGKFWIVDEADPTKRIAEVDQTNYSDGDNPTNQPIELSVPVTIGTAAVPHTYYLFAQHGAEGANALTDFYFMKHFAGTYYLWDVEKSPDNNNEPLFPEAIAASSTPGSYFFEGNLETPTDVDHFVIDVASGATDATLFCSAQRVGSGLRGAKFSLLKEDGSALGAGNVFSEVANKEGTALKVAIPAGTTKIVVKAQTTSQDPVVTGTYYRCGVSAAAP